MKDMNTVKDWRDFNAGRTILILKGSHKGEETIFIDMVWKNGKIPSDEAKPTIDLRMKVKTKNGTELLLKPGEILMIEKKIFQDSKNN